VMECGGNGVGLSLYTEKFIRIDCGAELVI